MNIIIISYADIFSNFLFNYTFILYFNIYNNCGILQKLTKMLTKLILNFRFASKRIIPMKPTKVAIKSEITLNK